MTKFFLSLVIVIAVLAGLFFAYNSFALTLSPPLYEIGAMPGQTLKTGLKVFNETDKANTFYLEAQNFSAKGEEGDPYFVDEIGKEGLASWIELPGSIHLESGELKQMEFTIKVPENADPGGYYAAIFLSTSPPVAEEAGAVGLAAKIGTLVLLRIGGEVIEEGRLIEFGLVDAKRVFSHLPIDFLVRVENLGTVHIKPAGTIEIRNIFGIKTEEVKVNIAKMPDGKEKPVGNILPESVRKFESSWQAGLLAQAGVSENLPETFWQKVKFEKENFALGRYQAKLNLDYGAENDKKLFAVLFFWVFPWHLALVSFIVLVLILILLVFSIRRYNRWIIKKSRINSPTST